MDWLEKLRKEKRMSQERVASECGISRQYYSFIESGERGAKLPVPTAKKIASVLGFDWVLFYDGKEKAPSNTEQEGGV